MTTLVCKERHGGSLLQQELIVLSIFLSGPSVENQACVFAGSICALHSHFARIEISTGAERMSQAGESAGIMDIKKNLRRLYEMLQLALWTAKKLRGRLRA